MSGSCVKWSVRLLLLSVLLLGTVTLTWAAEPKDVPADHWAYKAVKQLVDKGYLQLYQDQTFQGDQPVDRYTLATVVAKILGEIASGGTGTSKEDVKVLRSLTNELRQELVKIIAENNTYSKKTDEIKRSGQVLNEDIIVLTYEQQELQKEVQQMVQDLKALNERVSSLENEMKAEIAKLKAENKKNRFYLVLAIIIGLAGVAN
ncbi:MAG TPA: S-layer homology domain-containing protein [Bacillota bacterium]|nr:S-layer homology domain-containing protein [Bacillota bacterium]